MVALKVEVGSSEGGGSILGAAGFCGPYVCLGVFLFL
jgi:hypothetical protein